MSSNGGLSPRLKPSSASAWRHDKPSDSPAADLPVHLEMAGTGGAPDHLHAALDAPVDWSGLPAPSTSLRGVVVVPMRDEGLLVERSLAALAAQSAIAPGSFEVLVLANNCSDDTAEQARLSAAAAPHCAIHVVEAELPPPFANVGAARRALMEIAAARLEAVRGAEAGPHVILSTDGDTRVAPDWIARNLSAIAAGADAVGGRILTDPDPHWSAGLVRAERLDTTYRLLRSRLEHLIDPHAGDPWPRHHQHFGASLAISLDAYRRVGGLPRVPYLEDMALVRALQEVDCSLRHAPDVQVRTSGRLDGRAEVGLSWQLRQWEAGDRAAAEPVVAEPRAEAGRWALRRRARSLWQAGCAGSFDHAAVRCLATELVALDAAAPTELVQQVCEGFRAASRFGQLWQMIEPREAVPPSVTLSDAIAQLRSLVRKR